MQLRDDNAPSFKNTWTLFGGRVEKDEELEEALLRELDEELSLSSGAIKSLRQVQANLDDNGTKQYIYEIFTDIELDQLVLGEGAAMEYISEELLFDRDFAFNIKAVLTQYTSAILK